MTVFGLLGVCLRAQEATIQIHTSAADGEVISVVANGDGQIIATDRNGQVISQRGPDGGNAGPNRGDRRMMMRNPPGMMPQGGPGNWQNRMEDRLPAEARGELRLIRLRLRAIERQLEVIEEGLLETADLAPTFTQYLDALTAYLKAVEANPKVKELKTQLTELEQQQGQMRPEGGDVREFFNKMQERQQQRLKTETALVELINSDPELSKLSTQKARLAAVIVAKLTTMLEQHAEARKLSEQERQLREAEADLLLRNMPRQPQVMFGTPGQRPPPNSSQPAPSGDSLKPINPEKEELF